MEIIRTATAWESIGFDEGEFRIKGGRVLYQAVMYNCANNGNLVKLARLQSLKEKFPGENHYRIREVSRWVHPDTVLEFISK